MGQRMVSFVLYVAVSVVVERQGRRCRGQTADDLDVRKVVPTFSILTDLMKFDRIWLS